MTNDKITIIGVPNDLGQARRGVEEGRGRCARRGSPPRWKSWGMRSLTPATFPCIGSGRMTGIKNSKTWIRLSG